MITNCSARPVVDSCSDTVDRIDELERSHAGRRQRRAGVARVDRAPALEWPPARSRAGGAARAAAAVEATDQLSTLHGAIEEKLSPHRREVLVALALNEVPIDVLAECLNTTRGALYKTLHDGRQKLRSALTERGMGLNEQKERSLA
jgi:DNA-directed RNA polymerase specialized sigma24 family protein